jgi:hypothetical protein
VCMDFLVKMSFDDHGTKAKLIASLSSLDLDKNGCLSTDESSRLYPLAGHLP